MKQIVDDGRTLDTGHRAITIAHLSTLCSSELKWSLSSEQYFPSQWNTQRWVTIMPIVQLR